MKILLVHNSYTQPGGEDSVFKSELELLRSRGHEVEALLFDNKEIKTIFQKIGTSFNLFYNRSSSRSLKNFVKNFNPDVIHVHNIFFKASPSIFYAAKELGVPIIMTLHNYRLVCLNGLLLRNNIPCELCLTKKIPTKGVKYACFQNSHLKSMNTALVLGIHNIFGTWTNKIDKYIVLTEFGKNKILNSSLNLPNEKLIVKPNFTEDLGEGAETREDYFIYVGRLSEEKGILTLLEATQILDFKVHIFGEGPLKNEVLRFSKNNNNITYYGFKSKEFIAEKLKKASALIFPSTCYETFGLSIVESFSTATPVIASRLGIMQEIVSDFENGLLFNPGDAHDLSERIRFISNNKEKMPSLGKNARQTYISKYTPQINHDKLLNIYDSVCKS